MLLNYNNKKFDNKSLSCYTIFSFNKSEFFMTDFLSIWQHVSENYSGSTRDLFVTSIEIYEDEYGEVSDATADKWFDIINKIVA